MVFHCLLPLSVVGLSPRALAPELWYPRRKFVQYMYEKANPNPTHVWEGQSQSHAVKADKANLCCRVVTSSSGPGALVPKPDIKFVQDMYEKANPNLTHFGRALTS